MLTLMSKAVVSLLVSAATFTNPTTPKALSFDANAFVTAGNQIRLAVSKNTDSNVLVMLKNSNNEVLFRRYISKKEVSYAAKLNVDDLADGTYELEFQSNQGSIIKKVTLQTKPIQKVSRLVAMQ